MDGTAAEARVKGHHIKGKVNLKVRVIVKALPATYV